MLFNKTIWESLKSAYQAKKTELEVKKITKELLEKFNSIDGLKKWFDYKMSQIRPNGIYETVGVSKLYITLTKDDVIIQGELSNGTFINEMTKFKEEEVKKLAMRMAVNNLAQLKNDVAYYENELERTKRYIIDIEGRIAMGELEITPKPEPEQAPAPVKKAEKKLKKPSDVVPEKKRGRPKKNA